MNRPSTPLPLQSPLWRRAIAALLGLLSVGGFAPFSLALLPPVALTLLLLLWRHATPRQGMLEGWWYGFGLMAGGVYWVQISIHQFGGVSRPLAVAATLLFVMTAALYFGLLGWVYARLRSQFRQPALLLGLFPALWIVIEWFRGWFLTGFPWLSLGYSQIDSPLAGYAPVLGVLGVGWATALASGGLALAWNSRGWVRGAGVALPLLLCLGGLGLSQITWSTPAGPALSVALVQGNITQQRKWRPEQLASILDTYLGMTLPALRHDLVIWPETSIPAFAHRVDESLLTPLETRVRAEQSELLVGLPVSPPGETRYYNAMLRLGSGERDTYFKRHLVPFGEYLPLGDLLAPLFAWLHIPMSSFSPGESDRPLLTLAGYPAGISICYEDAFGQEMAQALPEAAFLINTSNDAWFGDSTAPHQHLEMARMRALESGRWLLRATNTGISALIDPHGVVTRQAPQFRPHLLEGTIVPLKGATPYARLGGSAMVWLALLLLATLFALRTLLWARPDSD